VRGFGPREKRDGEQPSGTWVALLKGMNPSYSPEDVPGLEGPDYVALVIEWGDDEEAVTTVSARALDPGSPSSVMKRKIATLVGALSAIALATWGLRRLRAVS
jgi:hypothetical protein